MKITKIPSVLCGYCKSFAVDNVSDRIIKLYCKSCNHVTLYNGQFKKVKKILNLREQSYWGTDFILEVL